MRKEDIRFEVTELVKIRDFLQRAENQADIDGVVIRLSGNMNDLLSEEEYADAAEDVLKVIDGYDQRDKTRSDILAQLNALISKMEFDLTKVDRAEEFKEMTDEVKAACSEIAGVLRRETKTACEEIQKAVRQEMPKCSSMFESVKGLPKKAEKKIKHGIKKWLDED